VATIAIVAIIFMKAGATVGEIAKKFDMRIEKI
jgi:hypothetical protein